MNINNKIRIEYGFHIHIHSHCSLHSMRPRKEITRLDFLEKRGPDLKVEWRCCDWRQFVGPGSTWSRPIKRGCNLAVITPLFRTKGYAARIARACLSSVFAVGRNVCDCWSYSLANKVVMSFSPVILAPDKTYDLQKNTVLLCNDSFLPLKKYHVSFSLFYPIVYFAAFQFLFNIFLDHRSHTSLLFQPSSFCAC